MRLKIIPSFLIIATIFSTGSLLAADGTIQSDLDTLIDIVVASDGSGDYTTVSQGINAVPDNSSSRTVLFIKNGVYREKVYVPASKRNLTMVGEHVDSTVIVYDDYAGRIVDGDVLGTFTSQTIQIDPDDFRAMNITFSNDARPGGTGDGQNVAVNSRGKRQVYLHCRFIAWQDTYYTGSDGRHYFKDCFIEGAVDYIFGHTTTIFDSCQIHTVRSGGYITAASTKENYDFGYVFFNSRLTAPPGISSVYLGRPWKTYAQTVFFECIEYENITPAGWMTWDGRENTCFYAEYNCVGPGSDISSRVNWSNQLTPEQAANYTMEKIFSAEASTAFGSDWDPAVDTDPVYRVIKDYTVMFMDSSNLDARIASLKMNGEDLPDWDPGVYDYIIELPSGSTEIPKLEASAVHPYAKVEIEQAESVPGFAEITILATDRASHSTYSIYYSLDSSGYNTALDSIILAKKPIQDFDPEVLEYSVVLPAGTNKYFPVNAYAQSEDTRVKISKPASYPGTVIITATAVDGSVRTYSIEVSISTGLETVENNHTNALFHNPFSAQLSFSLSKALSGQVRLFLYNTEGKKMLDHYVGHDVTGDYRIPLSPGLPDGLYFYDLRHAGGSIRGKLLKK